MLTEVLEVLKAERVLLCFCGDQNAIAHWVETGREALEGEELAQLGLTGLAEDRLVAYTGSLSDLVSQLSKRGIALGQDYLDILLEGVVLEREGDQWVAFRCRVVPIYCCAGGYLSVVNRKEVKIKM